MSTLAALDFSLLEHVVLADDRISRVLKLHCMSEVFLDRLLARQRGCAEDDVVALDLTYSKKLRIPETAVVINQNRSNCVINRRLLLRPNPLPRK